MRKYKEYEDISAACTVQATKQNNTYLLYEDTNSHPHPRIRPSASRVILNNISSPSLLVFLLSVCQALCERLWG
jgi:hypothetical protein